MKHHDRILDWCAARQNDRCPIAEEYRDYRFISIWSGIKGPDIHHVHIHDKNHYREKYYCFIDSRWNVVAVNHEMHMAHGSWGRSMAEIEVMKREIFLRRHPKINAYMNFETEELFGKIAA